MIRGVSRRTILLGASGLLTSGIIVANWPRIANPDGGSPLLRFGDGLGTRALRLALGNRPLVPEYRLDQVTAFPVDGGFGSPWADDDRSFETMIANRFRDWQLTVEGLVAKPTRFTLDEIRSMPSRTQVTMHCCDMGWSAIGQWTGVPLRWLLEFVGIQPKARYIVFHCLDRFRGQLHYGSIDVLDALHPQTILAHSMNGQPLPRGHGAPLRLRVELQLGYKNSKHIDRISVVDSLAGIGLGQGGSFEDAGSLWYGGW
jgi:DMSO/TMAO reductase YedYZ molybdopterin-dependent catalytic subunit